jgi:hypothetical protein
MITINKEEMKNRIFTLSLILATILLFGNCTFTKGLEPSKTYTNRQYNLKDYNAIDFSGMGDITYSQTPGKPSLTIYGPSNYLEHITVKVENGTLIIGMDDNKSVRLSHGEKIKITTSSTTLTNVLLKGVGNITIGKLQVDKLDVNNKGVGDIDISNLKIGDLTVLNKGVGNIKISTVTGNNLNIESSGVGNVDLSGTAHSAILTCKGVGDLNAEALQANVVEANCRGVGSISCYASESITATVKGVGSIRYKGNPKTKNLNKSGIGSIRGN